MSRIDDSEAKRIALEAINKVHAEGLTPDQLTKMYDRWADTYDEEIRPGIYNGPEYVAEALADYYTESSVPSRKEVKILDVAAGTGRIGISLQKLGFQCIDALDPSERMLQILKNRGMYGKIWKDIIGEHRTEIPDDAYDAVVSSGALGGGHIPARAVLEMVRIVRPGGVIVVIIREEYLTTSEEYRKLEPLLDELQHNKKIMKVSRKVVCKYSLDNNGVLFVYKVL